MKHYDIISTLVDEFQSKQKRLKTIEQRLEKVKKLYNILNSELIVYSFQNFLPILTDTINNALSKVVSFEITMKPEQKDNGELILNILFNDEHGEREATSLSGGQKTILKLVWMLSISIYLHTPLLFLDETINNLDEDAVSKVATLINEFVKQNDIKFYTITHNNEIQAMNIRDKTIQF